MGDALGFADAEGAGVGDGAGVAGAALAAALRDGARGGTAGAGRAFEEF